MRKPFSNFLNGDIVDRFLTRTNGSNFLFGAALVVSPTGITLGKANDRVTIVTERLYTTPASFTEVIEKAAISLTLVERGVTPFAPYTTTMPQ
jgi:hypothetical protein